MTQEEIASRLGVSVATLNEMLAIERKLTPEIKEMLNNGVFTKTTASNPNPRQNIIDQLPTTSYT